MSTTNPVGWARDDGELHGVDDIGEARASGDQRRPFVHQPAKVDDASDVLYQLEASRDYDPGPALEKIRAPLFAVNSADDLINPPELGILEREIKRVPKGRAVVVPFSATTAGHGTHTLAAVWKQYLQQLLSESAR